MVLNAVGPPAGLLLGTWTVTAGSTLVRVSTDALGTTEPSSSAIARRFSPVRAGQTNVPVLYAGADLGCALGETVFHDLDDNSAVPQEVLRSDLLTLRAGTLTLLRDVVVGDLRDPALAYYGVHRTQVTATSVADHAVTQRWAQHAWDAGVVDGLVWNSRRSPDRLAYLLFMPAKGARGVRRRRDVDASGPPLPLFDGVGLGEVMTAASARNVTLVIS